MADQVILNKSVLTDIGDAIRDREYSEDLIPSVDMADRIANLPTGIKPSYGLHCDENGIWTKPEEWDDIESIDISSTHECYVLCGCRLHSTPFVRLRVSGGGTITWSYGHVVHYALPSGKINEVGTYVASSSVSTISSGSYISLYLGNIEDEYIVIHISATSYLSYVKTYSWSATTDLNCAMPVGYNCVLMRYGRFYGGTDLAFQSYYLESDRILDFAVKYQDTTTTVAVSGAYSNNFVLQKVRLTGMDLSKNKITSFASMFYNCFCLSDVGTSEFDLTGWVTSNCTSIGSMFYCCRCLKVKIIAKNWVVTNVTNMSSMLNGSLSVYGFEGLETWSTAPKCTNVSYMFYQCYSLRGDLDLSALYLGNGTANFITVTYWFAQTYSLSSINLNNTNLSKVTSVSAMFNGTGAQKIVWDTNFTGISSVCTTASSCFASSYFKDLVIDGWDFSGLSSGGLNQMCYGLYTSNSVVFKNCTAQTKTWSDSTSSSAGICRYSYTLSYLDVSFLDFSICSGTGAHMYSFRDLYGLVDFYPPQNLSKKLDFTNTNNLSHDSLIRIIDNLATVSTSTAIILGTYNKSKLTSDELAIATGKGWTVS